MKEQLKTISLTAKEAVVAAENEAQIEALRVQYLGKKGELTAILKQMGGLSPEERPIMGQLANEVRTSIENAFNEAKENAAKIMENTVKAPEISKKTSSWES